MVESIAPDAQSVGQLPRPIPFFTQAASFEKVWPLVAEHVNDVADRGKYSHGRKVGEFEKAIAAYTGARFAIGVNSGTDALVLLLRAAGLRPGDEVVVPAFSFFATASSVSLARGVPVFADIDPVSYSLDPASAAAAVTDRTRAVMPVHLFHQMADMAALRRLATERDLILVEDSAEAIGMRWDGTHAGLLGAGGVLSFFPTKTLGALGDAGMILTDDPEVAELAGVLRHHGRLGRTIDHIAGISNLSGVSGTNSKMDDLQAAVLMAKLTRLDEEIARRAELAAAYTERLAGVPGVLRTPRVVPRTAATNPVWYVYVVEVERRDELVAHLTARGVGTETYYPSPLHLQPCFADLGHRPGQFPNAEAACARTLALPLYPDLGTDEVDRVVEEIRSFYGGPR
ncbi:MAG: Pleiotropic regulatory protein [uncultured Corynebacteriales bacterium]|uniref:Pleiotropic regulatory protein n=1 Tax=uncultured Mycobacteriales bacterium TaxID=581187 RepID=A0A6J4IIV5_9ACTN|nr:MAG: Pleiotropic regulatory protein [uncultured Corynebacteriales bacterium]